MMRRAWTLIVPLVLLGGCARERGAATVNDEQIARLPEQERQNLLQYEQRLSAADSNVQTASAGREDASVFAKVSRHELEAANEKLQAAQTAMELGRNASDQTAIQGSRQQFEAAQRMRSAAQAKVDYAERLIALRAAEVEQAEAMRDRTRAELELQRFQASQRHGMAKGSQTEFDQSLMNAQNRVAETQQRVQSLTAETNALRGQWETLQRQGGGTTAPSTVQPPASPKPIDINQQPGSTQPGSGQR
jgi:hypothetical protein